MSETTTGPARVEAPHRLPVRTLVAASADLTVAVLGSVAGVVVLPRARHAGRFCGRADPSPSVHLPDRWAHAEVSITEGERMWGGGDAANGRPAAPKRPLRPAP